MSTPAVENQMVIGPYPVTVFRTAAYVTAAADRAEVLRRQKMGVGAVTDRGLLEALMGLPAGLPVPVASLTERERTALLRAPQGVVERVGDILVRHVVPPLTVRLAIVTATSWRQGLERAGRFAPFCQRGALLPSTPRDLDEAQMRASFYGVGLAVLEAGVTRTLVEPEPYVRRRHSSAQWWFVEEIYRQIISAGVL
jgi:hypothetical protein